MNSINAQLSDIIGIALLLTAIILLFVSTWKFIKRVKNKNGSDWKLKHLKDIAINK